MRRKPEVVAQQKTWAANDPLQPLIVPATFGCVLCTFRPIPFFKAAVMRP